MSPSLPFLYHHRLSELLHSRGKSIVMAAPGMGKSTFLHTLESSLCKIRMKPTLIKPKTDSEKCEEDCKRVLAWMQQLKNMKQEEKYLLIDDLDLIFCEELENAFFDINFIQDIVLVVTSSIPTRTQFLGGKLDFGLNERAAQSSNHIIVKSRSLTKFMPMWLLTWENSRSEAKLKGAITLAINEQIKYLGENKNQQHKWITPLLETHKEDVQNGLLELSGGHPALLNYAINKFFRRINTGFEGQDIANHEELLQQEFQDLKISLEENYPARIHGALSWAERLLPEQTFRQTLDEIIQQQDITDRNGYMMLHKAGMVKKQDNRVVFICDSVRKIAENRLRLLDPANNSAYPGAHSAQYSTDTPVTCSLKPKSTGDKGMMICQVPGKNDRIVEFSPNEWQIIRKLEKKPEKLVSVEDLIGEHQENQAATRSALQRLMAKLRQEGLDAVVTNIPRKGYIFKPKFTLSE